MLGIYIHIPFCIKKCLYCSFYSSCPMTEDETELYTNALINEIVASKTDDVVTSVYFGGGTPSFLGSKKIEQILKAVRESYRLSENCEITIEVNPASVPEGETAKYLSAGINRLSIGMQSIDDKALRLIGRVHNYYDFINLYAEARKSGFKNISVDIMYGLPNQKTSEVLNTLIHVAELKPEHISFYGLTLEEGTPLFINKAQYIFPDEEEEQEMYLQGSRLLEENGYEHYEISNFAKQGYQSCHNNHYWNCGSYLGFGVHAHSFYNDRRFSCNMSTQEFISSSNGKSVFELTDYNIQKALTEAEKQEEQLMLGLRTSRGVLLNDVQAAKAQLFIRSKLMIRDNEFYKLTDSGMLVSNSIISDLLI